MVQDYLAQQVELQNQRLAQAQAAAGTPSSVWLRQLIPTPCASCLFASIFLVWFISILLSTMLTNRAVLFHSIIFSWCGQSPAQSPENPL